MTDLQKIKQKMYEQKSRIGLVGGSIKVEEYDNTEHYVSAEISQEGWNISISLKKGFNPIKDSRQKAYARAKKIDDGLEKLLWDVGITHEPAHWELPYGSKKGCPYDIYNHDKILEAVKQALPQDKKEHADYVANAFEDMIINPRCKEFNNDFSGQVLFWDWEGISCREKGLKHYTPFYEAFVKLNMHLFGDNKDRALLKRHYSNGKKIDDSVKKVINDLSLPENVQDSSFLFEMRQWPGMASKFAKDISDLLEQAPEERPSAYSCRGKDGGQTKKENQKSGNGIEQKMGTREGKEEISFGRYSSREKQSTNITSYEQLDSLYRKLARAIPVNVEAMTKEQSMAICPLTYRAFDAEKDDGAKIKLSKIFLEKDGIQFGYQKEPLVVAARSKMQKKSFPDFKMVILDNSGSMEMGIDGDAGKNSFIPWGDNSKYHHALLGFYGIENFLQRQGIAQYISHGLSLFSDNTRYKESDFQKIDELRKLALAPEFKSTHLDAKVLLESLKGRESFVLSISDGEIANWDSEKKNFRKLAENNYFAHIQIGGSSEFSEDLESWELPVFHVNSGKDLSKLMVNIATDTYRRFTRE